MKTIILTTFTLLYLGLIHAQLSPNQKSELAIHQKRNFKYNAQISSIKKVGTVRVSRVNNNLHYSVFPKNMENKYGSVIEEAFLRLSGQVDLSALQRVPVHFYIVNGIPERARKPGVEQSSLPWVYEFYDDLMFSGAATYTRIDPNNFDSLDYRIVLNVPNQGINRDVLMGNILKGIARILHENKLGPDIYWGKNQQPPFLNSVGQFPGSSGALYVPEHASEISWRAALSNKAFVSEFFAVWVMGKRDEKVPNTDLHWNLINAYATDLQGPRLNSY